ncbi:MAG: glycoside hydrolase family 5 protein [Oscillospiraceae bacterium]|nr:glycoside hydrolase family 5 protein [Oscillospiraceae bacterium]
MRKRFVSLVLTAVIVMAGCAGNIELAETEDTSEPETTADTSVTHGQTESSAPTETTATRGQTESSAPTELTEPETVAEETSATNGQTESSAPTESTTTAATTVATTVVTTAVTTVATTAVTTAAPPATTPSSFDITAAQLVANIRVGWNLGNSLDATDFGDGWLNRSGSVSSLETCWGNPVTTKRNIDDIKKAGFNAIRIPVSWAKACDKDYNIRADWMARVKEVVDYAVANDMYIILNTHHDEEIFKVMNSGMPETKKAFEKIWKQIAEEFKGYNEKLVFEGLNEPRTKGSSNEWSGGTAEERNNVNALNQLFVDTVRATGGNNSKRILMIPTYAASGESSAMNALVIPKDTVSNKIIVSIHVYSPWEFALKNDGVSTWDKNKSSDTNPITSVLDRAYNLFVSKGVPVIMGEMGTQNRNNTAARAEWAEFYTAYAKSKGIACFWWDNGGIGTTIKASDPDTFAIYDRRNNKFLFPEIVDALMRGTS